MLRYELNRVFRNKLLYLSIAIGAITGLFGLGSFYNDVDYFYTTGKSAAISAYEAWLYCLSLGSGTIYKIIMPLLISLPFVESYLNDYQSGRLKFILIRQSYSVYFLAKVIAVAVSAAVVILSVLTIWLLVVSLLFPNTLPNTMLNYFPLGPFDHLYPTKPLTYIAILIFLNILSGIIYAWIGLGSAVIFRNKFSVVCAPLLLYLGQMIIPQLIPVPVLHVLFPLIMIAPYESINATYMTLGLSYMLMAFIAVTLLYKLKHKTEKEYS